MIDVRNTPALVFNQATDLNVNQSPGDDYWEWLNAEEIFILIKVQ